MPSLDSIISVTITRASATVSRTSFGIPMLAGFHNHYSDLIRVYSATNMLSTMVADGFATSEPLYKMAQAMLAQNPRPRQIKVGKLSTFTQIYTLVAVPANSTVYSGRVNGAPWTFTSDSGATAAEVATGIAAAITALAGVTAAAFTSPDRVEVTADVAGQVVEMTSTGAGVFTIQDTTAAGTLAADLGTLKAADVDWYSFGIDRLSGPAILAAATWAETQKVVFMPTTIDTDTLNPATTTDIASSLQDGNFSRTSLHYSNVAGDYLGLAVLAKVLPFQPGSTPFYYQVPALVAPSNISTTAEGALTAKNANWLARIAGVNVSENGVGSNGDYFDNKLAEDWVVARVQEEVFTFLLTHPDYSDRSVERLKGVIASVLQLGVDRGVIAPDPLPIVDAPKVATVSPAEKAARNLPDVIFGFTLAGGLKTISIEGLISV